MSIPADTTAWWVSQVSMFVHRYLASPDKARHDALLEILKQYAAAVEGKRVEPPRFM